VIGKKLLVVEDDYVTRALLRNVFEQEGYAVAVTSDAPEALDYLTMHGLPHLVLVDLGLPSMHGFDLCRRIKRLGDVPIIILTGNTTAESATEAIRNYAEDYVRKPFNIDEIVARVQRVLSRLHTDSYTILTIDDHLAIDFPNSRLTIDGQANPLTPIESNLLYLLINNRGRVVGIETLMQRVWANEEVYEETVRVHMHRLRGKLRGKNGGYTYIRTVRGEGYAFDDPHADSDLDDKAGKNNNGRDTYDDDNTI
jgi:DNA-binding response OmpR family regulator